MTLEGLISNVQAVADGLQSGSMVRNVVSKHGSTILDLQKYQLLQGKRSRGDDMRPYYSEDLQPQGYFKSTESAKRYADWKQMLSYPRSADRNADAPNLYINGKFHNDLDVTFGTDSVTIDGGTVYGKMIVAKYGIGSFGLTAENWSKVFFEFGAYNELLNEVKNQLFS